MRPDHPPFARQAAGTPPGSLPFGQQLCDAIATLLDGAGRDAREAIEELACRDLRKIAEYTDIVIGDTRLRVLRSVQGPNPRSVRFGIIASVARKSVMSIQYRRGMITINTEVPPSVLISMRGRMLGEVIDLPSNFPGADRRIIGNEQEVSEVSSTLWRPFTYRMLSIRVPHRQDFLSYDDIEHGRQGHALAA